MYVRMQLVCGLPLQSGMGGRSNMALSMVLSLAAGRCSFMFAYIEDLLQRRDFEERHR
jgi:hypothetical protein